jgi:tyrosyl-tRNA synthetase
MAVDDADVRPLLLRLTLRPIAEIEALVAEHERAPERREGQRALARSLTALVHGDDAAAHAEEASAVLFGGHDPAAVAERTWSMVAAEVPATTVARDRLVAGVGLVDLAAEVGLTRSKGEARKLCEQSGISVNDRPAGPERVVDGHDLLRERFVLLRRGKRTHHLVIAAG